MARFSFSSVRRRSVLVVWMRFVSGRSLSVTLCCRMGTLVEGISVRLAWSVLENSSKISDRNSNEEIALLFLS